MGKLSFPGFGDCKAVPCSKRPGGPANFTGLWSVRISAMRLPALLCAGALLVAALAQQASLPEPLATDLAKLAAAKELKVSYSFLVNSESQGKYQLEMAKDGLFRLNTPSGFVVGDGKNVYSYSKSSNSYSVAPEDDAQLAKFANRPEVFGWGAFLEKSPGAAIESGTPGAVRTVSGAQVQDVDVVLRGGKGTGTVFVDSDLKVTRGFRLKEGDKLYLAVADSVELPGTASTPDKFAFVAPDGSKKVDAADASGP